MRKYLYLIAVFTVLVLACKKYKDVNAHLTGKEFIAGRVFAADSLNAPYLEVPKSNILVRLSVEPEGQDYIVSVTSDSAGYFSFEHLAAGTYYLFAEDSIGSVKYSQRMEVGTGKRDIRFVLNPAQTGTTGASITVLDPSGSPLTGAVLCAFRNAILVTDTGCNGAVRTETTGSYGKVNMLGLSAGQYVINARYRLGLIYYFRQQTITVTENNINYVTINFAQSAAAKINSVTYVTQDSLGGILSGVQVCGFASLVLANDSCFSSTWMSVSDTAAGKAVVKNVPPGPYVVFLKREHGNLVLRARDTIPYLSDSTVYSKTLRLR